MCGGGVIVVENRRAGLIVFAKIHVYLEPVNVTLSEIRRFADVIDLR